MSAPHSRPDNGPDAATLDQILITDQLSARPDREPCLELEILAMRKLASCLRIPAGEFLQRFADLALEIFDAGSAGVSLLEKTPSGEEVFCWAALSGTLAPYAGARFPRNNSPSGVCLDIGGPVLLSRPARAFSGVADIPLPLPQPIVEVLVLPLYTTERQPAGTVWLIAHDNSRQFDREDLRLFSSLAQMAVASLQIGEKARHAEAKARTTQIIAAIALALNRRESLQGMLQACAKSLVDHVDAAFARVWTLSPGGLELVLQASAGIYTHLDGPHSRVPVGTLKIGRIAAELKPHLTNDVLADPQISDPAWARQQRIVSFAGYPLIANGELVGVMACFARHPLGREVLDALDSVASGIALGIRQKQAEEELQLSEERYRSLVEMSSSIVWESTHEGSIGKELPGWAAFTGLRFDDYRGSGWLTAFHPADQHRVLDGWLQAVRSRREFRSEARLRRYDGNWREVEIYAVPIFNADGELREWIGTYTDVTERKLAQQLLIRTNEELREFSHVVAHDLQAPLRNVGVFTELLGKQYKEHLDPSGIEMVGYVQAGVARMRDLIRSLLEYAEAGRHGGADVPVNTDEIVLEVCHNLQHHIAETSATVVREGLPVILGNRVRIAQLFQNLVANSLKYRDKHRAPVIAVSATRTGATWLFSVKDNGEGIEPQHFESIFKPLKRLHGQEIPGTGIGLALCDRIVHEAEGRIWVESELHHGSTFYFTWPHLA